MTLALRSRLAALTFGLAGLALVGAGCGSPCGDLADRVCKCQPKGPLRDNCSSSAKSLLDTSAATSADQAFCTGKLATCPDPETKPAQCELLRTDAGKEACGLAVPQVR